ncbi:solute carrier family 43 member 3-like [Amblyraja radiata]|uniref:solute carrier family 43 member 3-like n=1 Tax=Amblyraja radiata TaxID=386614 RepID=UPI0014021512|nr:solute carrier family 43 member 3-like [Amblyraja radiata]
MCCSSPDTGSQVGENEEEIPTFRSCVFSRLFLSSLLWFSLLQLRFSFFIGTLNPLLNLMTNGDPELVSRFTNAFAFTQLFTVLCAPLNGLILDRRKWRRRGMNSPSGSATSQRVNDIQAVVLSLALTVTLSVLFSLAAAIPIPEVQYLTFVLFMINRSFLYGGLSAFLAMTFPPCHFGKLYGATRALAAIVSLLQYPFFTIVKGPLQDDPLYMNIGFIALVALAYAHPINVFIYCRWTNHQLSV